MQTIFIGKETIPVSVSGNFSHRESSVVGTAGIDKIEPFCPYKAFAGSYNSGDLVLVKNAVYTYNKYDTNNPIDYIVDDRLEDYLVRNGMAIDRPIFPFVKTYENEGEYNQRLVSVTPNEYVVDNTLDANYIKEYCGSLALDVPYSVVNRKLYRYNFTDSMFTTTATEIADIAWNWFNQTNYRPNGFDAVAVEIAQPLADHDIAIDKVFTKLADNYLSKGGSFTSTKSADNNEVDVTVTYEKWLVDIEAVLVNIDITLKVDGEDDRTYSFKQLAYSEWKGKYNLYFTTATDIDEGADPDIVLYYAVNDIMNPVANTALYTQLQDGLVYKRTLKQFSLLSNNSHEISEMKDSSLSFVVSEPVILAHAVEVDYPYYNGYDKDKSMALALTNIKGSAIVFRYMFSDGSLSTTKIIYKPDTLHSFKDTSSVMILDILKKLIEYDGVIETEVNALVNKLVRGYHDNLREISGLHITIVPERQTHTASIGNVSYALVNRLVLDEMKPDTLSYVNYNKLQPDNWGEVFYGDKPVVTKSSKFLKIGTLPHKSVVELVRGYNNTNILLAEDNNESNSKAYLYTQEATNSGAGTPTDTIDCYDVTRVYLESASVTYRKQASISDVKLDVREIV